MKQKSFTQQENMLFVFYALLATFGLVAMIVPSFAYQILGLVIGIFTISYASILAYQIYQHLRISTVIPLVHVAFAAIVFSIGVIFIFIPARSIQFIVGLIVLISLALFSFYNLYVHKYQLHKPMDVSHWMVGIGSAVLATLVLFNLNKTTEIFMFILGGVFLYYALMQIFTVVIRH
jgi:uncharacterized membrane protein HdeD (DUF308 family)